MAEYEKRAMTSEEDKYTFSQSSQIAGQSGLIGYLRADMDTDGNGFLDTVCYDLDGDRTYECRISLAELGLDDRCEVLDVSKMKYKDYTKLFKKVSTPKLVKAEPKKTEPKKK